jgi:hypothetical protein
LGHACMRAHVRACVAIAAAAHGASRRAIASSTLSCVRDRKPFRTCDIACAMLRTISHVRCRTLVGFLLRSISRPRQSRPARASHRGRDNGRAAMPLLGRGHGGGRSRFAAAAGRLAGPSSGTLPPPPPSFPPSQPLLLEREMRSAGRKTLSGMGEGRRVGRDGEARPHSGLAIFPAQCTGVSAAAAAQGRGSIRGDLCTCA